MVDRLGPAACLPEFLGPGRAGMKADKVLTDIRSEQQLVRFRRCLVLQMEPDSARGVLDPERFQQGKVVINGVQVTYRRLHELVVAARAQFRPQIRMVRGDSLPSPGKKGEERRPIVAGEVEAVIEFPER